MEPTLSECRPPWVVVTRADDPWVATEVAKLREQGGKVVRLAGRELHSPSSLFTVFARELSFPGYFGHNWNALVDCLHDWHGHETTGQGLAVLIDADGIPHGSWSPFPLHFVFLLSDIAPSASAEGAASGTDVDAALVDGRLVATLAGPDWPGSAPVMA